MWEIDSTSSFRTYLTNWTASSSSQIALILVCLVLLRPISVSFLIRTSGKEYHNQAGLTTLTWTPSAFFKKNLYCKLTKEKNRRHLFKSLGVVGLYSLVIDWSEGVAGGFDDAAGVLCRVPVPGGTSLLRELGRRSGRCQILRQTSTSRTASKENIILGSF